VQGNYEEPYKFTGYERDQESDMDYAHDRNYIPKISIFDRVDRRFDLYPHQNNYAYCGNNPILYNDPNGEEKLVALDPSDERTPAITNSANDFKDNGNAIHIWAHGNSDAIGIHMNGKNEIIDNVKDFEKFLSENSEMWQNRKEGEQMTIVLHSCNTGEGGKNSFAAKLSEGLENTTVVAPSKYLGVTENTDGTYSERVFNKEINQNPYSPYQSTQTKISKGNWVEYSGGKAAKKNSWDWIPNIEKQQQRISQPNKSYLEKLYMGSRQPIM
jgi:RHS repeat-associated protein